MKPVSLQDDSSKTALSLRGLRLASRIVMLVDWASRSNRRCSLILVLLCCIAFLPGFFSIPVLDRDEARFALVTRQMVETGQLAEVRIGSEGAHTRPLGWHWLQAGLVASVDAIGMDRADRTIWLYRLPSLFAAIAAVLLTFWAALAFTGRRAALFAAILLAGSASVGVAARLAMPDALMLAAAAAMIGSLARLYLPERAGEHATLLPSDATRALVLLFWGAIAAALFMRGLLALFYPLLALCSLMAVDRSLRPLRATAPVVGVALCGVVGLLWYLLRHFGMDDRDAVAAGRALMGRLGPSFSGAGGPPGTLLVTFWGMFWPGAPLAALAVPLLWKARRQRAVQFLLAWVIPAWIVLELIPTKFPAHLLPLFPAVAIAVGLALERGALALSDARLVRLVWLWPVIGAAIAVFALLGLAIFDRTTSLLAWPLLLLGFFALVTAAAAFREYGAEKASLLAVVGMLISGFGVMQLLLPQMRSLWVSPRVVEAVGRENCPAGSGPLVLGAAGYDEPSLAFLLPGSIRLMDGAAAADFLREGGCHIVLIERRQEVRFVRRAEALGLRFERTADIGGVAYADGRGVRLSLYRRVGG
ncbi:ArnT family glycosyltransferase [Ancylobacter radicis]|uniref:Glycosyl transferase n=1 Tax=Ancylobacter radicis TaxID=2836179 RepID=A0ABS5RAB2_9HYPH|nr:glycosyl transferase [Ancylobacter radicis]MBS9477841.1 glycosyl transferase [Ancylobacter radicis]